MTIGANGYWNGWWDQASEGTFVNVNNGKVLGKDIYQPWYPGEPNGKDRENCLVTLVNAETWNDFGCFEELCGFCDMNRLPVYTLRGSQLLLLTLS